MVRYSFNTPLAEVLPHPPSYSAVRAMLRVLERKGHIRHEEQSLRYVFSPTVPREKAKRAALRRLLDAKPMSTLVDSDLTRAALDAVRQ